MSFQLEIQLIAALAGVACAIPGTFLMLRRKALMGDVISHAILPGIVLAFFATHSLSSPLLIVAAAATGILTVFLIEQLEKTGLLKEDAAMGITFPVLFSIGVILIARFASDVHLDTDAVILGELAFAPFDRVTMFGRDLGPKALWEMLVICAINITFVVLFFKELKLTTFDAGLAASFGFSPVLLHYGLMSLVSVTAVGAFDAVGSILVVALMIAPPAAAYLLTDRLSVLLVLSAILAIVSAVLGYWIAHVLDASIAGGIAAMNGIVFLVTWLFAPHRGLLSAIRRRHRQKWEFAERMLLIHLLQHEGTPEFETECREDHLTDHISWTPEFAHRVVEQASDHGNINRRGELLELTYSGRKEANEGMAF